jgi:hypothetical protein
LPLGSAVWENTFIELPAHAASHRALHNIIDGTWLQPVTDGDTIGIAAAQALARFPVALLYAGGEDAAPEAAR